MGICFSKSMDFSSLEDRQAVLSISLSTSSPAFSLSSSSTFAVILSVHLHSLAKNLPISIVSESSILDKSRSPPVDRLAERGFFLECISDPDKQINLGSFSIGYDYRLPVDFREKGYQLLVIKNPDEKLSAAKKEAEAGATVKHPLSLERMMVNTWKPHNIPPKAGETWKVQLTQKSPVGFSWYWGDVNDPCGLGKKKLSPWHPNKASYEQGVEKPEGEEWLYSEDPDTLWVEFGETEVEFDIVE